MQGENGRGLIKKYLIKQNYNVSVIECYKRTFNIINISLEVEKWRYLKIDTLVITSGEILTQLDKNISIFYKNEWLFKCKIVVVGKRLENIAKKIGWKDIVISDYANNTNLFKLISKINTT